MLRSRSVEKNSATFSRKNQCCLNFSGRTTPSIRQEKTLAVELSAAHTAEQVAAQLAALRKLLAQQKCEGQSCTEGRLTLKSEWFRLVQHESVGVEKEVVPFICRPNDPKPSCVLTWASIWRCLLLQLTACRGCKAPQRSASRTCASLLCGYRRG